MIVSSIDKEIRLFILEAFWMLPTVGFFWAASLDRRKSRIERIVYKIVYLFIVVVYALNGCMYLFGLY